MDSYIQESKIVSPHPNGLKGGVAGLVLKAPTHSSSLEMLLGTGQGAARLLASRTAARPDVPN